MRLLYVLFLLILAVPLLEIYLLIKVGGLIGAFPTLLLVILTAVIGVALLRQQGWYTWRRARNALAAGEVPAMPLLEGVVLLMCGLLLLTPGFFTDAIGFLGLVPPLRRALIRYLIGRAIITTGGTPRSRHRTFPGEYKRED